MENLGEELVGQMSLAENHLKQNEKHYYFF